jgi:hypothetical protein
MPFPYPKIIDVRPPSDTIIARLIVGKRHCRVLISLIVMRSSETGFLPRRCHAVVETGKNPVMKVLMRKPRRTRQCRFPTPK